MADSDVILELDNINKAFPLVLALDPIDRDIRLIDRDLINGG